MAQSRAFSPLATHLGRFFRISLTETIEPGTIETFHIHPDFTVTDYVTFHFILTLFLLDLILGDLKRAYYAKISTPGMTASEIGWTKRAFWLFVFLSFASFGHTWYHMFKYMAWSFANYHGSNPGLHGTKMIERITPWLKNTNLFKEAWIAVSETPLKWWWSEQLCLFTTGAWTVFLSFKSEERQIPHAGAYMVLGQLVGISVASNLFYAAVLVSPHKRPVTADWKAGPFLYIPVMLSFGTIYLTPSTVGHWSFLPNLIAMHTLPVLPLLLPDISVWIDSAYNVPPYGFSLNLFYRFVYVVASGVHISSLATLFLALDALQSKGSTVLYTPLFLGRLAWKAVSSHPARLWNAWDVVWTNVGFVAWVVVQCDVLGVVYLLCAIPIASIGGTAPFILRRIEDPAIATLWNQEVKPRLIDAQSIAIVVVRTIYNGAKSMLRSKMQPNPISNSTTYKSMRDQDAEQKWGVQAGRALPSVPHDEDHASKSRWKIRVSRLEFIVLACAISYEIMRPSTLSGIGLSILVAVYYGLRRTA